MSRGRGWRSLAVAAAMVALGARANAAPVPAPARDTTLRRGVQDTVTVLPPVHVRGARPGLAPDRATATSVRLERANVTRFLPATVGDALVAVPGVELVKTGPWASRVALRGLSGDRVIVMVDGVRLNTVRGHGVQPSLVALDRLDAVEVLPGASSAQFGSDALGGVVNLVTHRELFADVPSGLTTVWARAAEPGGTYQQQARARFGQPRLGFEITGGLGQVGGLATPDGRVPNSGDRERNFAVRGGARLGASTLDLEHAWHAAYDVGLPAFANQAGSRGEYPLQSRAADRLEWTLPAAGPLASARLLAVHQTLRTHFDETTVDSSFLRGRFVALTTTGAADRVRTRASSVQPTLRLAGPGGVRLFGEWRHETADGPRVTTTTVTNAAGDTTAHGAVTTRSVPPARRDGLSVAAFGGGTWKSVRLEAGLRHDQLRARADSTTDGFTPKLDVTDRRWSGEAGVARPIAGVEPYAHVATGFRAPNLEERYFDDEIHGGMRLFGNPDLRAERSVSWEGGVRSGEQLGGRLASARISAYRSRVEDLITFRYIGAVFLVPRFQYQNVRHARIEGMEYAAAFRFGGVALAANAAFPRGFDLDSGERLADVGTGRVTVDLTVPLTRWLPQGAVAARLRWNDAVWTPDTTLFRPAFTTLALEASCTLRGVRAALAVRNLLDASYREPQSFIPEPGRTFALLLRRDFAFGARKDS